MHPNSSRLTPTTSILNSKGQITIPKTIRDILGIKPGDRITFAPMSDGTVSLRVKNRSLMILAGILDKKGHKLIPTDVRSAGYSKVSK